MFIHLHKKYGAFCDVFILSDGEETSIFYDRQKSENRTERAVKIYI